MTEKEREYHRNYRKTHREKRRVDALAYYRRNRVRVMERQRTRQLKLRYGLSKEQFEKLLAKQHGRCAICRKPLTKRNLHVDHCHVGNFVRGILCNRCNLASGLLRDSAANAERLAEYLKQNGLWNKIA